MTDVVLRSLLTVNAICLVLLGLSVPYLEPGTGSFVVAVASAVVLVPMTALVALMIRAGITVADLADRLAKGP